MTPQEITTRLEYLRKQINGECISYGEIAELQSLAEYIDKDDVQLLEWAGVPEFPHCHSCGRDDIGLTENDDTLLTCDNCWQ